VDNNGEPKYERQGFREEIKDGLALFACMIQYSRENKKKEKLERKERKEAKKKAQG
jgi:hypothetical protein